MLNVGFHSRNFLLKMRNIWCTSRLRDTPGWGTPFENGGGSVAEKSSVACITGTIIFAEILIYLITLFLPIVIV
jgi:hypothetical protein